MSVEKRIEIRVPCDLGVQAEFVPWKDDDLSGLHKPFAARALDLSASGARLDFGAELNKAELKRLLEGTRKIKLALRLPGLDDEILLYARVVWSFAGDRPAFDARACGCAFVNPSDLAVWRIRDYVKRRVAEL